MTAIVIMLPVTRQHCWNSFMLDFEVVDFTNFTDVANCSPSRFRYSAVFSLWTKHGYYPRFVWSSFSILGAKCRPFVVANWLVLRVFRVRLRIAIETALRNHSSVCGFVIAGGSRWAFGSGSSGIGLLMVWESTETVPESCWTNDQTGPPSALAVKLQGQQEVAFMEPFLSDPVWKHRPKGARSPATFLIGN